jgi:DNA-directed RNA polymerase specialized sigma24 family protein
MAVRDTEQQLLERMRDGSHAAFKELFYRYYPELCCYTEWHVRSRECAEELVSDLFVRLWENRASLAITNIRPYLYQSAKNRALNYLRKQVPATEPIDHHNDIRQPDGDSPYQQLLLKESHKTMNRLSYREIASLLKISVRTVEDQMLKAVKTLRSAFFKKEP